MTTADKLTYLNETKDLIKQAIVNKGVEVSTDTPFRQYAGKIGEISGGGETNYHGIIKGFCNYDATIDENGIASDFANGSKYIYTPYILDTRLPNYKLTVGFSTGDDVSTQGTIVIRGGFDPNMSFAAIINASRPYLILSNNGSGSTKPYEGYFDDSYIMETNTDYILTFERKNGSSYEAILKYKSTGEIVSSRVISSTVNLNNGDTSTSSEVRCSCFCFGGSFISNSWGKWNGTIDTNSILLEVPD